MSRRVLLPSDQRDWVANFAHGYRQLGWDVVTGAYNFDLEASAPEVLHINWPEELCGWRLPTEGDLSQLLGRLRRWSERTRVVLSVNNLYPHGGYRHPTWHRLYSEFYDRAHVIHHFSEASRRAVCDEFPRTLAANHVVRVGFNYDAMLPSVLPDRDECRARLSIRTDEVAFLVLGAIRQWTEAWLVLEGFRLARVPGKRLLLAARFHDSGRRWARRARRVWWAVRTRARDITRVTGYVPNSELLELLVAADVVLVARTEGLSSGLPCLGMTFGRMVVAPDLGAIPEYLGGGGNLLYRHSSVRDLAAALRSASSADREAIGNANRTLAATRGWDRIVGACIEAFPVRADG